MLALQSFLKKIVLCGALSTATIIHPRIGPTLLLGGATAYTVSHYAIKKLATLHQPTHKNRTPINKAVLIAAHGAEGLALIGKVAAAYTACMGLCFTLFS